MEELRFEPDGDMGSPHIHEELEIIFVLSGRVAVMTTSHNFVLETEGIAVFNAFQHHEIYCPSGSHALSCLISSGMTAQADIAHIWCCSTLQPEQIEHFNALKGKLAVIFKEYQSDADMHTLFIRGNLFELLDILKTYFEKPDIPASDSVNLQEILYYISSHYSENLSLHQVAGRFFMSSSFLSRKFKKEVGMNFSEYLRKIRIQRAAYLLQHTERSVTDIAVSSGFTNTNVLIDSFKRIYEKTPGEFRKAYKEKGIKTQALRQEQVSYMSLFRYLNQPGNHLYYTCPVNEVKAVPIDAGGTGLPLRLNHKNRVSVGRAKNIMLETVRKAIEKAHEELGIQYIAFHGILDDAINVYHQNENGERNLNFFYVDLIFDFLVSSHVIPVVELSFTPEPLIDKKIKQIHIYSNSLLYLPDDLEGWQMLIRGLVKHFMDRYGEPEVSKWIFSCCPGFYASYKVYTIEKFAVHYELTYRAIRDILPTAKISGFILDMGFCAGQKDGMLEYLLNYCNLHGCLPDELSFQCFHCEYSLMDLEETEKRINVKSHAQTYEPAEISMDPDYLSHGISYIQSILEHTGNRNIPISISTWNSSIWQCELGNDTCYKAAWIVKNVLENLDNLSFMCYSQLTDYSELVLINANTYHGGHGLITFNELPKAGYHAYMLLNQLEGKIIDSGKGYCVTRSEGGCQFQIMLYHYCHYNEDTRLRHQLSKEEERTYDRYYSFCADGMLVFQLLIEHMKEGRYELVKRNINRRQCSSYDNWMNMGAPHPLSNSQRDYLKRVSVPGYQYSIVNVDSAECLTIAESLDAHEVCLITLKRI